MDLRPYFDTARGHGILATADAADRVNMAIFSRPHVFEDQTLAFIMPHHLTHSNLQSNPHAAYLFTEEGPGYTGKRLYLTKLREEQDTEAPALPCADGHTPPDRRSRAPASWFFSR